MKRANQPGAAPVEIVEGLRLVGPQTGVVYVVESIFALDSSPDVPRARLVSAPRHGETTTSLTMRASDLLVERYKWTVAEVTP